MPWPWAWASGRCTSSACSRSACRLPIELGYDGLITALSLLIAILSSGFALWLVSQPSLPLMQLAFGALIMGAGISAMHYTGMAALRMQPGIDYDPTLFSASLLIAVSASAAALWIAFHLRHNTPHIRLARSGAAVIMGVAIVGMHYTGMAAANFAEGSFCGAAASGLAVKGLDNLVLVTSLAVLSIALLTSVLDARLEERTLFRSGRFADPGQSGADPTGVARQPHRSAEPDVAG